MITVSVGLRRTIALLLIFFISFPAQAVMTLTLDDAVLLAVRTHPNVTSARLSALMQTYNVQLQKWAFWPQYSFQASTTYTQTGSKGQPITGNTIYAIQPAASWQSPIGTQVTLNTPVANTGNFNAGLSLQVSQPLLRGFGRPVVEAALNNAKDSVHISQLAVESTLRVTVSGVINAYLDYLMAQQFLAIDRDALKRAEKAIVETRQFIRAGHKAGTELITVKANAASAQLQLTNDENNLLQTKYALLTAIGLAPETEVNFVPLRVNDLIAKYHVSDRETTKEQVLAHDIQYETDRITLEGPTSRALLVAKDNTRWQLNVGVNAATGNGFVDNQNSWVSGLFNGTNRSQSVGLTLNVPIDNQELKVAVLNAKIAIRQAKLALRQEKWAKQTEAINAWNVYNSALHALQFAKSSAALQSQTYTMSYQKYLHGLIDGLELQTAQSQLLQSEQALLSAQIAYVKSLVNLDGLTGHTLNTWGVTTSP